MTLPVPTDAIVQPLREALDPLAIYVFGSYARGDYGPDSDLDLLVVCEDGTDRRHSTVAARVALANLPVPKDVVVTTPKGIQEARTWFDHVVNDALREGCTLYTKRHVTF